MQRSMKANLVVLGGVGGGGNGGVLVCFIVHAFKSSYGHMYFKATQKSHCPALPLQTALWSFWLSVSVFEVRDYGSCI